MNVTYQKELFDTIYEETKQLLSDHYSEIAEDQDILTLNPDVDVYRKLETNGALHILTARTDKLIGYFVGIVHPHLHYKDTMVGNDDIYFIHPDYRNGRVGYMLIQNMIDEFKRLGCKLITIRTKVAHDNSMLLTRLGMRPFEKTFLMRLE